MSESPLEDWPSLDRGPEICNITFSGRPKNRWPRVPIQRTYPTRMQQNYNFVASYNAWLNALDRAAEASASEGLT